MGADAAGRRRRQHPDALRRLRGRRACSSTGALPPCASRPPTSSARRCATCSSCAAARSPSWTPRSSPRRCPSSSPSGPRWRAATWATRCWPSAPAPARAWRSATTTRARSAPTGSSTRSPSGSASAVSAVCVDFGTATTFDVVSREGEYLGGSLMTGIEISLEALSERGARLPKVDLAPPRSVIGKNTIDAIRSGVVYGYAGADRRDPAAPVRRARRTHRGDRHRRAGVAGGAVQRGDRGGRRTAHADRPAPAARAQLLVTMQDDGRRAHAAGKLEARAPARSPTA